MSMDQKTPERSEPSVIPEIDPALLAEQHQALQEKQSANLEKVKERLDLEEIRAKVEGALGDQEARFDAMKVGIESGKSEIIGEYAEATQQKLEEFLESEHKEGSIVNLVAEPVGEAMLDLFYANLGLTEAREKAETRTRRMGFTILKRPWNSQSVKTIPTPHGYSIKEVRQPQGVTYLKHSTVFPDKNKPLQVFLTVEKDKPK